MKGGKKGGEGRREGEGRRRRGGLGGGGGGGEAGARKEKEGEEVVGRVKGRGEVGGFNLKKTATTEI